MASGQIRAIDKGSVHRITSGQVVVDLQTAVKELVENSLDAGATNIEIRFKNYGLKSLEVIDNGCGISEEDFESIALKHHTSKLETYEDLNVVQTFGFRGEALSSLCALCEKVVVATATKETSPKGTSLEMRKTGEVGSREIVARQKGTTVSVLGLFSPLPVRRKELERNAKREFSKALNLLHAYAVGPCAADPGVRLSVVNFSEKGQKSMQIQTQGAPSRKAAAKALWGPKALDNVVDLNICFQVDLEKSVIRRLEMLDQELPESITVEVKGLISKFAVSCGRLNTDRQYFYINGRPCNLPKVQKAFNEVYRTFNANQSPFVIADFTVPTASCDVNVSPDKRTILLHNESNLIHSLKIALETEFSPSRSTFDLTSQNMTQTVLSPIVTSRRRSEPATPVEPLPGEDASHTQPELEPSLRQRSGTSAEEAMNVDTRSSHPSPRPSTPSSPAAPDVVLDTTKSAWSQQASSPTRSNQPQSLDTRASPLQHAVEVTLPPVDAAKTSRKRSPDTVIEIPASTFCGTRGREPEVRPQKRRMVAKNLGPRLASFAMPGSQIAVSQAQKSEPEDGDDADDDSNDEIESTNASEYLTQPEVDLPESDGEPSRRGGRSGLTGEDDEDGDMDSVKTSSDLSHDGGEERGSSNPDLGQPGDERDEIDDDDSEAEDSSSVLSSARQSLSDNTLSSHEAGAVLRPEIIRRSDTSADISVRFDMERVATSWNHSRSASNASPAIGGVSVEEGGRLAVPSDASVRNCEDNERAVDALSRVIEKSDFASMDVVGQFNLGFIIARRRRKGSGKGSAGHGGGTKLMDDLFIVDQHAADEKFNFETLQQTTKIQSQKLLRPREVELTAADELVASENLQVLKDNGFEVRVDGDDADAAEGGRGGGRSRLRLMAQPVSKNTVFDIKDLEELIHLLRDSPSGTMVRCSKARAMFASRACRKSVMVGMPLNHTQMSTVMRHMGTMDQPWNCPHGRPTMRHLADIATLGSSKPLKVRPVDWTSL